MLQVADLTQYGTGCFSQGQKYKEEKLQQLSEEARAEGPTSSGRRQVGPALRGPEEALELGLMHSACGPAPPTVSCFLSLFLCMGYFPHTFFLPFQVILILL